MISNFSLKTVITKILLLSSVSGSILVGMENECCSVQIRPAMRITSDRAPVRIVYPIVVTDKTTNKPPVFYSFDHAPEKITCDAAAKHIAVIRLSDGSVHRFDAYERKELERI